jgi:signal transduction histidine kinase
MELDEATRQNINLQITENTNRITGLVNKMLELSDAKSQTFIERKDNVSVVQIASEAVETSGINTAKHLTFDFQVPEKAEKIVLQTNLNAAVRALSLLLDNARKFTAPAGTHAGNRADASFGRPQQVVLRLHSSDNCLYFVVEDTGIGVPEDEAERIFDEFVQLDNYYDGTGIGLTVARSLARRLGGDIVLDTSYKGGARFVMILPMKLDDNI